MFLTLHGLTIHLDSGAPLINHMWRHLFTGWLATDPAAVDLRLRLSLVDTLPPPPERRPFFSDTSHLSNEVGILSVYRKEGGVLLHFLDGGLVRVPLCEEDAPTIEGAVTRRGIAHGRFEDITFTSLAPLLRRRGYFLIHAFAAARDGAAVCLVGPSGSGKTTTGLALLLDGWRLLANDVVLAESRPDGVYALPTPGLVNIRPPTLDLLPGLRSLLPDHSPHRLANVAGDRLVNGRWAQPAPIRSVYFPQIEEGHATTRSPENQAVCLAQLMAESVDRWDPDAFHVHLNLLQTISRQAPSYRLHLGQDLRQIPPLIANA